MMRFLLPVLLVAAVVLGGSSQASVGLMVIGLLGAIVLAFGLGDPSADGRGRNLGRLAWAFAGLVAFQLLPLPPAIWEALPARGLVSDGDRLLGTGGGWRPLSLAPHQTLASFAFLVAPLAMLVGLLGATPLKRRWLAWSVVGVASVSALFASAQVGGLAPHLFAFTSDGPTGFFANTNHLGTLMIAAIPFVAALASRRSSQTAALRPLLLLLILLFLAITLLTGSVAMIALALPVTVASLFLGRGTKVPVKFRPWLIATAAIVALSVATLGVAGFVHGSGVSLATRLEIWHATLEHPSWMLAGSGFGTFQQVFQLGEDMFRADRFYVNHAHNDFLQLAVEGGVPAIFLMALFLGWWSVRAVRLVRAGRQGDPYARAGMLASAAILAHSLVDFPLRTEAIAVLMALSLGLMARPARAKVATAAGDLRETRHRKLA